MSSQPNLGRQFDDPSISPPEEKVQEKEYDPGLDITRFSAIPGQQVFDFGDRVAQAPKSTYSQNFPNPEGLEHDVHGFISDPSVPQKVYGLVTEQSYLPHQPRTLGPDHPLHTLQDPAHTSASGEEGKGIEDLRHVEKFSTRPLVVRTEGRDVVVNGHHRIAAARRRGDGSVDVDYMDADAHKLDFRHGSWETQPLAPSPAGFPSAQHQEYWDPEVPSRAMPPWHELMGISPSRAERAMGSIEWNPASSPASNEPQPWSAHTSAVNEPNRSAMSLMRELVPSEALKEMMRGILRGQREQQE